MEMIPEPNRELPVVDTVDVLVVGGGPAGIGAALSAARLGAKTMIVEQFNCLGGVATSGGHNHFSLYTSWSQPDERIVGGVAEEMRLRVLQGGYGTYQGGCIDFDLEGLKLVLDQMVAEAGVDVLYYTFYCDTLTEGDTVTGGIVQNKSGRQAIRAHRIVDCTGDGDAAAHAGAAFDQGRPEDGRCQPCTLMFTIGGVDWPRVKAWRKDYQMREIWLQAQTTLTGGYLLGDTVLDGGIQRVMMRGQMTENRVKPAGEWNVYEIRSEGDTVSLWVNGAVVNEWKGLVIRKGYIGLEAEGYEITFRNLKLKELR